MPLHCRLDALESGHPGTRVCPVAHAELVYGRVSHGNRVVAVEGGMRPHSTLTSLLGTGVSLQRHSTIVGAERAMAANDDRNPGGVGKAAGAYSACAR